MGGIFPLLAKAATLDAVGGVAGYGAKRLLGKLSRR